VSLWLTGSVAAGYATGLIGLHRLTVFRRRQLAGGYPTLRWLDWDTLLASVLPDGAQGSAPAPVPPEGGPAPRLLTREGNTVELELLRALVQGLPVSADRFAEASFSGGEARWLGLLTQLRDEPRRVLETLEAAPLDSVTEAYLREWLVLEYQVTPLNLELVSFASKRRLNDAMNRFGEHPALSFARARASSLLGFTNAVLDDVARAVYFSRQAPFYVEAVGNMPFVEEVRPALARACREVVERQRSSSGAER
jgi:hypothetical protein